MESKHSKFLAIIITAILAGFSGLLWAGAASWTLSGNQRAPSILISRSIFIPASLLFFLVSFLAFRKIFKRFDLKFLLTVVLAGHFATYLFFEGFSNIYFETEWSLIMSSRYFLYCLINIVAYSILLGVFTSILWLIGKAVLLFLSPKKLP